MGSALAAALHDRFLLERELGRGGMATVYLAHDLKHDRLVALKVLRSELAAVLGPERFLQEIRLTARLRHPHILPVFDSGEAEGQLWYTMPYVDGESLRERLRREVQLPLPDALRIATEVAEALDHSHRHGVIHRDIKPENILLEESHAVVADFGIARALSRAAGATSANTEAGVVLGSPAYMSPEQAMGEVSVDGRTDVYALGCVLYEMLAGAPPLMGPTAQAVLARRLGEPAPRASALRVTVTPQLDAVIGKALASLPADRFTTAAEFARALESISVTSPVTESGAHAPLPSGHYARGAVGPLTRIPLERALRRWPVTLLMSGVAAILAGLFAVGSGSDTRRRSSEPATARAASKSVAVLPFRNLGDSSHSYYAEGFAEELSSALVRIQGLAVRPRGSVDREVDRGGNLEEVGRRLKAEHVIAGSVRPIGRRIRVNVELVHVDAGATTWSQSFDVGDISASTLQESIVSQVASALSVEVMPIVRNALAQRRGTDASAYDLYLQGRHFANLETLEGIQQAVALYNQAVARDSGFADGWVALGGAYDRLSQLGDKPSAEIHAAWRRAVERAIALDSLHGEAYVQRAHLRNRFDWDYEGADRDYRRAIALTPGSADPYLTYAQFLNVVGLDDSALAVMRRAVDINPTVAFRVANLVPRLRMVGRLDEAAAEARRALTLDSTLWIAHLMLGAVLLDQGKPAEAALEAERGHRIAGDLPFLLGTVARYYGRANRRSEAVSALAKLNQIARRQYVQWVFLAEAHLGVNDRAGSLDALEESAAAREPDLTWKLAYGHFDELRNEPRLQALLSRVGLAETRSRE